MSENIVYYHKYSNYGTPGHTGITTEGQTIDGHYGGIMICPRCGDAYSVAHEQIEHYRSPFSVAHVTWRLDTLEGTPTRQIHCGAHYVTGDPETPAQLTDLPEHTRNFIAKCYGSISTWWKRPITWHGDK